VVISGGPVYHVTPSSMETEMLVTEGGLLDARHWILQSVLQCSGARGLNVATTSYAAPDL
jgi:hypothetical protein